MPVPLPPPASPACRRCLPPYHVGAASAQRCFVATCTGNPQPSCVVASVHALSGPSFPCAGGPLCRSRCELKVGPRPGTEPLPAPGRFSSMRSGEWNSGPSADQMRRQEQQV